MKTDLESAYLNIETLLEEAVKNQDKEAETLLLANKCRYFFQKENPEKLVEASDYLFKKAVAYNDTRMQAVAKIYLAESLKLNGLYENAIAELEKALFILKEDDSLKLNTINTKSNIYISFANTYSDFDKPKMAVNMMKLGGKEFNKFPEGDYRDYLNYLYHSNLGVYFLAYDIDSSQYHAHKSILLKPEDMDSDDTIMLRNYLSLGTVYMQKGNYEKSIKYLTKLENLAIEIGENINLEETYIMLIDIAKETGNQQMLHEYESKFQVLELEQFRSKNKSLHKILEIEKSKQIELAKQKRRTFFLWTSIISTVSVLIIFLSFRLYRKKIHLKYEKLSKEYLAKNSIVEEDQLKIYNEIIELVKKDDPAFMVSFHQAFPNFTDKLLKINPKLAKGEVEFCALLKLKLTTKQIAQYKVLQPRTVQNKKYQIRKKLNIPNNIDIYNWVHSI